MGRRLTAFLICTFIAACAWAQYKPGYAELNDSETVTSLKGHVSYIASPSMNGRAAGSEGEALTAMYVTRVLSEYGVEMLSGAEGDLFGIKRESGDTLTSRNVIGVIQGRDPALRDNYLVIGARMDNIGTRDITIDGEKVTRIFPGANGNASGLALMLELARMVSINSLVLKRSVIFAAFGASMESYAGSWYFLNRSFPAAGKIDAMVNLDSVGIPSDGLIAFTSSNADLNACVQALAGTLQPIQPVLTTREPIASDHRSFYAKEIPSVLFTTGNYRERGTERDTPDILEYETMERELEYIYDFTIRMANGPRPDFNPNEEARRRLGTSGSGAISFYECDYRPTFLGSDDPRLFLQKWVYPYLRYPKEAVHNGVQGRVLVDFVIDERGKVTDVKVLKGVDDLLDAEAVRVISASPDWKPGRLNGRKVKSELSIYVEFKLEKKKK